jgi:hypothetical protein
VPDYAGGGGRRRGLGAASVLASIAAATLIALGVPEAASAQPAAPMDPTAFAVELDRLSTLVSAGEGGVVPELRVPTVWVVEAGGQRFELPALWLSHAIREARRNPATWPSRRTNILAKLNALKIEAQSLAAARAPGRSPAELSTARATLARVLARPEFKRMAQQSAVSRLRQRFSEWLLRMWDRLGGGRLGRRGTAIVFAWVAALLALGALSVWLIRLITRSDNTRRLTLTAPPARRRSARLWARDALAAADPREAARCAYRAAVSALEEEGAWRPDDTRTPREYLRLLPQQHRRQGLLADVTRRFEEIWYGARAATEEDRRSLLGRLKELGCLPAG